MSLDYLVGQMVNRPENLRLRQATVVSVESTRTCTIKIAGQTAQTQKVRYLSNVAPLPGYHVWVATDGTDLLVIGHVGAADKTLAPRAYRTALQSIPLATDTLITFQAVDSDAWSCWSSGAPTKLTVPVTGRYICNAQIKWSDGAAGVRRISVRKNGNQEIAYGDSFKATGHGTHTSCTSPPVSLTKGDYIETIAFTEVALDAVVAVGAESYVGWFPSMSFYYLGS